MSEQNKYEEEWRRRMNDLPLPDKEEAWQHMQRKLDEEDKRRRMLPPFVLNCLGVVLVLALLGGGWYLLSEKNLSLLQTSEQKEPQHSNPNGKDDVPAAASPLSNPTVQAQPPTETVNTQELGVTPSTGQPFNSGSTVSSSASGPLARSSVDLTDGKSTSVVVNDDSTSTNLVSNPSKLKSKRIGDATQRRKKNTTVAMTPAASKQKAESLAITQTETKQPALMPEKEKTDPVSTLTNESITPKHDAALTTDTVEKEDADSSKSVSKDSAQVTPIKKQEVRQKKIYFTAGLGLQQMIPLDGQSSVPYNKEGRTASLSDYLPSVWVRMHKGKWFLQGEFRYGAPQSVKELSFAQRTKYDNATGDLSVTKTVLRKTYYHQLPLTLNYRVHKNISIGAGGMYSHFYGAVTQQEVRTQNVLTGQESFKSTIVPVRSFNDSFLYKTQVHLLLQADYHWRRFNLGLRYSTDLQPYIKYTMPDGSIRTEKNHSLQFFLRYRLFPFKKL